MGKVLGIAFEEDYIRLVSLKKKGKVWDIRLMHRIALPKGAISEGEIMMQHEVYTLLKNALKTLKIKTKEVCIKLGGKHILSKYVPLDAISVKEAQKMLKTNKRQYMHLEGDYVIEGAVVGEKSGQELGGLLVAAPNRIIQPIMGVLSQLMLSPKVITIPAFSYCKLFETESVLVVDLGLEVTTVTFIEQGACYMVRQIAFGKQDIMKVIASEFGSGSEEDLKTFCERYLMIYTENYLRKVDFLGSYTSTLVVDLLEEKLIPELHRTLAFYRQERPHRIDQMYITGEVSQIKGMKAYLKTQFDLKVKPFNPVMLFDEKSIQKYENELTEYVNLLCLTAFGGM